MFQVNQVVAASVVPPAVSAATLAPPTAGLNDIAAAPLAASGICTSTAPTVIGEVPKGIAGKLVVSTGQAIKRAKVSLVQNIGGVETTVAVTNTATGDSTDGLNWLAGYFAFPPLNLSTLGGDGSFSLKFEASDILTEYYLGRYSLQTAITLTATTLPNSTCDVRDKSNTPSLGTNPFAPGIKIYSLAGIAGRVTLAIPPDSLYASPPMSAPLTSDLYPVAGAQVDLLRISAANPNIITGTDTVSTDADGYYRIGDVLDSSSSNLDEVFVVRYSSPGLLPRPAEGGSYWRDGNLNFRPFINGGGQPQFPSYYITKTIRIDTSLIPVGDFRTYITSTVDSYPGIYGINGHLFAGSIVTGTVYSETNTTIAPAGTKVQLYNKTGDILIDEKTTQVSDSGVFTFTGLAAGQTYTLKGVPRVGDPLIARWHLNKPKPGDLVAITPTGTSISTTVGTQDIILVPGAKFSGRVIDPSLNGIPGVQVQIFPNGNPSAAPIAQVVTDGAGNYTTQGVMEPGSGYKLGFLPTGTSYIGSFCNNDPRLVAGNVCTNSNTLGAAAIITANLAGVGEIIPANITLQPGKRIAGRIQAREGATLLPNLGSAGKDVQVQITVFGGPSPTFDDLYQTFITSTAANIATLDYITAGLPDGNYKVRFAVQDSPNNTGFATVFYSSTICPNSLSSTASECLGASDKTDPTTTIALDGSIVVGGTATNKNITLQEGGQVTVILTFRDPVDNTIKSASNVAVEVIGDCGRPVPTRM